MTIKLKFNDDWAQIAGMMKKLYPVLSDSDLRLLPGGEETIIQKLAARLKLPQEEICALLLKLKLKTGIGVPA